MQKLVIKGGRKLSGTIEISGSKNATLPILTSTILTNKKIILKNVPVVKDVETMVNLLKTIGSSVKFDKKNKKIEILNNKKLKTFAPYYLLKTMRAGVLVLGSLLAKYKNAKVSLPGGCAIGSRPIDLHLDALKKMAIVVDEQNKDDQNYKPMAPSYNTIAFQAAKELVLDGLNQPSGYTEPILHKRRLEFKSTHSS